MANFDWIFFCACVRACLLCLQWLTFVDIGYLLLTRVACCPAKRGEIRDLLGVQFCMVKLAAPKVNSTSAWVSRLCSFALGNLLAAADARGIVAEEGCKSGPLFIWFSRRGKSCPVSLTLGCTLTDHAG